MRNILIAGNWKMNGSNAANAELIAGITAGLASVGVGEATGDRRVELLVCPPMPYLQSVSDAIGGAGVSLGAQTVSEFESGAYTGESSAHMLKESGCSHVIVGHSERRALFNESSEDVAKKFAAAAGASLVPVLCLGETLEERQGDRTQAVINEQLDAVVDAVGIEVFENAVIAYEPVWAIGTGMTATPEQAQAVHAHIRGRVATQSASIAGDLQILYGGSMKGENAMGLLSQPDIDGGLIGGASLKAGDFLAIAQAAAQLVSK